MKKYKIINKKRFFISVVFIVSIGFLTLLTLKSFVIAQNNISNIEYKEVYKSQGDTVWDISLRYKPDKSDVRDMVAEIRDYNNLEDLSIKPGDVIKVPLRKK